MLHLRIDCAIVFGTKSSEKCLSGMNLAEVASSYKRVCSVCRQAKHTEKHLIIDLALPGIQGLYHGIDGSVLEAKTSWVLLMSVDSITCPLDRSATCTDQSYNSHLMLPRTAFNEQPQHTRAHQASGRASVESIIIDTSGDVLRMHDGLRQRKSGYTVPLAH